MRKLNHKVWPYQTTIYLDGQAAADQWCRDRFGIRFKDWYSYSVDSQTRLFAFKDEASLLVFKLAWNYKVKT
jgi:hypothetical protein